MKKLSNKSFTTKDIAVMAVLAAMAYLISFFKFPIFPSASFLHLDFSNVFIMLAGFIYGPVSAVTVGLVKELLSVLTKTSTGGIGELANFIVLVAYAVVPATLYRFRKGIKVVILGLVIGCVLQVVAGLVTNRYLFFPLYGLESKFKSFITVISLFNLIKAASVSVLTLLLYKRIKKLIDVLGRKNAEYEENGGFISHSEKETFNFAVDFSKTLKKGTVVTLSGELGAGKTAFTKGLAKGLGLEDSVTSPTYAYLNVYGDLLYHYDCYRLSSGEDAAALGLTDYFNKDNICVIEWSEKIADVLPKDLINVNIEKLSKNVRRITVNELHSD